MSEFELTDREYIKRILTKNCNFRENRELKEKLQAEMCLDIPSAKEALIFAMYTNIYSSILLSKELCLKLNPPECLSPTPFAREVQNVWFGPPSLPPPEIPEIPIFPFKDVLTRVRDAYPQIFEGEKHLIVVTRPASESKHRRKQEEHNYVNVLNNIENCGKNFTDYVLMQLPEVTYGHSCKEFYVPEDFFEYMSGIVFRKKGYLVGKPIFPSSDDAGAYLSPSLVAYLRERGILKDGGFFGEIFLSESLVDVKELEEIPLDDDVDFIYIEAKSSPVRTVSCGFKEAKKRQGWYHHRAFATGPLTSYGWEDDIGLISFDENGNLIFKEDPRRGYAYEVERLQQILKRLIQLFLS